VVFDGWSLADHRVQNGLVEAGGLKMFVGLSISVLAIPRILFNSLLGGKIMGRLPKHQGAISILTVFCRKVVLSAWSGCRDIFFSGVTTLEWAFVDSHGVP